MDFKVRDKYIKMMWALDKLKKINEQSDRRISSKDARDATEDFFNQCYHLKDWFKKEYPALSCRVEDFINKSKFLSLAADYANSFKHAGLDKKPRSGKNIEKIKPSLNITLRLGHGAVSGSSSLFITIDGNEFNSLDIAKGCVYEWEQFFKLNNINLMNG
jgi:hypothetical protein